MNANRDNEEHEWPCTECVSVSACVSDEVVAAAQFDGRKEGKGKGNEFPIGLVSATI